MENTQKRCANKHTSFFFIDSREYVYGVLIENRTLQL